MKAKVDRQKSGGTKIATGACISLIFVSIIISQQQTLKVSEVTRIYDRQYVSALRDIAKIIPHGELVAAPSNVPQVSYFTDHEVIRTNAGFLVEVENFGRATIDFMRKNNCSYLIIPEDASFASERSSGSYPKTKVQILDRILEMMGEYKTESSVIHVYRLPSGITDDKIHEVTDFAWPKLYVDYPINGTTIELSRSNGTPAINVIGTAIDADSGIKKVEAYMDRSSFKSADLIPYNDSYKWSISFDVTSEGTKKIMVRATDNAAHITYQPVYLSIKYLK